MAWIFVLLWLSKVDFRKLIYNSLDQKKKELTSDLIVEKD